MACVKEGGTLLADKAYDTDAIRKTAADQKIWALSQIFQQVKTGLIPGRNYAASSAKTLNGEPLSFANWFLRIMCATSMPAMVAAAE